MGVQKWMNQYQLGIPHVTAKKTFKNNTVVSIAIPHVTVAEKETYLKIHIAFFCQYCWLVINVIVYISILVNVRGPKGTDHK